ncbi:MAG: phosphotransferase [Rhodobacteraceae bacterium]|nr:phosphotransferase [Paracoccaceae bacterium]
MTDRASEIDALLARHGWAAARREKIAGDGSARVYHRLFLGSRRAILMDAPPSKGESTSRFATIARWLSGHGYSAPQILAADDELGLMIVEDLGEETVAQRLARRPADEAMVARGVVAFLADLRRQTPPEGLACLDPARLGDLVREVIPWIAAGLGRTPALPEIPDRLQAAAEAHCGTDYVVSLRDFHAGNLVWIPERPGIARLGLLDFQDAVLAHPAYDLVSYLQDVRRDLPADIVIAAKRRFAETAGLTDPSRFDAAYAVLGAQRALRIVGVFLRLVLRDGKPQYLDYLPRTIETARRNLDHPALVAFSRQVREALPIADSTILDRARTLCGNVQTP